MKGDFQFVGGRLAVDFVNTEIIVDGERRDLLQTTETLAEWVRQSGASKPSQRVVGNDGSMLEAAHELRAALRAIFECCADGMTPPRSAVRVLNAALLRPLRGDALRLVGRSLKRESRKTCEMETVLRLIADDAADLVTSGKIDRLRACAHDGCILMFLDQSPRRARRWCSMAVCGNRAKAAAHRRRSFRRAQ